MSARQPMSDRLKRGLAHLASLADGWHDGEISARPPAEMLERVEKAIAGLEKEGIRCSHLYPAPDGGVYAEWDVYDWQVSLMFLARPSEVNVDARNRLEYIQIVDCRSFESVHEFVNAVADVRPIAIAMTSLKPGCCLFRISQVLGKAVSG